MIFWEPVQDVNNEINIEDDDRYDHDEIEKEDNLD